MSRGDERRTVEVKAFISNKHVEKLKFYAKRHKMPMSRLIGIAIDNEMFDSNLDEKIPFQLNTKLPDSDYIEYTFAHDASKIVRFLKGLKVGMSLDLLIILRHDMNIPDKSIFLEAFRECLEQNMVEFYDAPRSVKYPEETILYRLKTNNPTVLKKVRKKISDFEKYQKLKKKFKDE